MRNQNILQYLIATALLASIIAPTISVATHFYYVKPNDNTTCPSQPCHSLSYYIQNQTFDDYTAFYFLGGTHVLEQEGLVMVSLTTNLSLIGESTFLPPVTGLAEYDPPSKIKCTRRGGFAFLFSFNIVVSNLAFINCGAGLPQPAEFLSSTLSFHAVAGLNIFGIIVRNSSGCGLIVSQPHDTTVISHSAFLYNTGSEDYAGANVFITTVDPLEKVECQKDGQDNRDWTLIIDSSLLAFGSNIHYVKIPAGLVFILLNWPCIGSQIVLNNVNVTGNGSPESFGGNIAVGVLEKGDYTDTEVANNVITITNSIIGNGEADFGGGMCFIVGAQLGCSILQGDNSIHRLLYISNTTFASNVASHKGGGLYIELNELCTRYEINVGGVNFTGNKVVDENFNQSTLVGDIATGIGGNVAISTYRSTSAAPLHSIIIENCIIRNGRASIGAGMVIITETEIKVSESYSHNTTNESHNFLQIANTLIADNNGVAGVGVSIMAIGVAGNSQSFINSVQIQNSTIRNNTGYAGSAMYVLTNGILPYSTQNQFLMQNVSFQYNHYSTVGEYHANALHIDKNASVTVALQGVQNATFVDCDFSHNNGTGILAIQSYVFFQGDLVLQRNIGKNGGGLSLFGSFMVLKPHTRILFLKNHAQQAGGAIYVESERSPLYSIYCFLQPDFGVLQNSSLADMDVQIVFENNTAEYAGSALYGGYIDLCLMINGASNASRNANTSQFIYLTNMVGYSKEVFDAVFDLENNTGLSVISSDPFGVCICSNEVPHCDQKLEQHSVFPGSTYQVSVAVVGQREGGIPGIVHATLSSGYHSSSHFFGDLQASQSAGKSCTLMKYTIFSSNKLENITLTVDQPAPSSLKSPFLDLFIPPTLSITMLPCPPGFNLTGNPPQCNCALSLLKQNITCNITDQTIHRRAAMWIGYHYKAPNTSDGDGVIIHNHCPFDYCKQEDLNLSLSDPDEQCAFNHHGILCGKCKTGLSLALGSSQCMRCSNKYLTLILAFVAAGLALILLLTLCNLTVAEGAINGLIFYANSVHINHAIFFPQGDTSFLSVFMAWVNLDLGIKVCFYDGLDAYTKTWLQLLFPLYIWTISIVIIVWSYYSIYVTRLISRNAIKVLATLFLLSYTKLLRMTIAALSFTVLKYPDQHEMAVWLYDGSVEYLRGKHIPLFLAGVSILFLLSLPYTFLLLLRSCLQNEKRSCRCLTTLIIRWKPLLDAYTGPYKDRYRFWTGLLLLCRNALFLVFAFNALGNPDLNLLAIGLLSNCLLLFGWGTGGVYRWQPLNILESSFFLNLATVSLSTMYTRHTGGNQYAVAYTSAGIAFVTFTATVVYYTFDRIRKSRNPYQLMSPNEELDVERPVMHINNKQCTEQPRLKIDTADVPV